MDLTAELLERNGRREGGEIRFLCPAHDDHHPSARWNPVKEVWICDACRAGGGSRDLAAHLGLTAPTPTGDSREAVYRYVDENGRELYQAVRREPGRDGRKKSFMQRHACPQGVDGFTYNLGGNKKKCDCPRISTVLFRLPAVLDAAREGGTVLVVEGEKDALTAEKLGFIATTAPMGALKWKDHYAESLRGAHVVVLPDNDPPGRDHALMAAESLAGKAASVAILRLPDLPDGGDLTDWVERGGTREQLERLLADVISMAPNDSNHEIAVRHDNDLGQEGVAQLHPAVPKIDRWARRPPAPPVRWTVHHLLQEAAINLLAGAPGVGKTLVLMVLAACVATGTRFLGRSTRRGPVMILNFDDPSESIPRRFMQAAARALGYELEDLDIYYWQPDPDRPYPARGLAQQEVFEAVKAKLEEVRPHLLVVDAFVRAFPHLDGNRAHGTIEAFEALRQLRVAAGDRCCLVLCDHTPKPAMLMDNRLRGASGSQQKAGQSRTVHLLTSLEPSEGNGERVIEWRVHKANAAPPQLPFGITAVFDDQLGHARLELRELDTRDAAPKLNQATLVALTLVRAEGGKRIRRQDLITEITRQAGVSESVARQALAGDEFRNHPNIAEETLPERGAPKAFSWTAAQESVISDTADDLGSTTTTEIGTDQDTKNPFGPPGPDDPLIGQLEAEI